jgi:hypothetical protein
MNEFTRKSIENVAFRTVKIHGWNLQWRNVKCLVPHIIAALSSYDIAVEVKGNGSWSPIQALHMGWAPIHVGSAVTGSTETENQPYVLFRALYDVGQLKRKTLTNVQTENQGFYLV